MEKKRIVPIWVTVILLALCVISAIANTVILADKSEPDVLNIVEVTLLLCAAVLSVIYCITGYSKSAHKVFFAFSILLALAVIIQISLTLISNQSTEKPQNTAPEAETTAEIQTTSEEATEAETIEKTDIKPDIKPDKKPDEINNYSKVNLKKWAITISSVVSAICLIILTFIKNLGKKVSYTLVVISLVAHFIAAISYNFAIIDSSLTFGNMIRNLINTNFTCFIMVAIYGVMIYAKYQDKTARGTK